MAAIAFDRFYAIVRATVRTENLGLRYGIIYTIVWIFAFLLTLPIFALADAVDPPDMGYILSVLNRIELAL